MTRVMTFASDGTCPVRPLVVALLLASCLGMSPAQASQIVLSFDVQDPTHIESVAPLGATSATVKLVLQVDDAVPNGSRVGGSFWDGCCDIEGVGHFVTDHTGLSLNSAYFETENHLRCLFYEELGGHIEPPIPGRSDDCADNDEWGFHCGFRDPLPVVSGQSYFIAEGVWTATCDTLCPPPSEFTYRISIQGGATATGTMTFRPCPVTPAQRGTWGAIKSIYR